MKIKRISENRKTIEGDELKVRPSTLKTDNDA